MGTAGGDTGQQAFQVVHGAQVLAEVLALAVGGDQGAHRVVPRQNAAELGQWPAQPIAEQTGAGSTAGAVDGGEQ